MVVDTPLHALFGLLQLHAHESPERGSPHPLFVDRKAHMCKWVNEGMSDRSRLNALCPCSFPLIQGTSTCSR